MRENEISEELLSHSSEGSVCWIVSGSKFLLNCQAFDLEWGWRWPCCDRDEYLVSIITRKFAFEKQQDLYHNKVTLRLTPIKRLGNQPRNCKMDNCFFYEKAVVRQSKFLILCNPVPSFPFSFFITIHSITVSVPNCSSSVWSTIPGLVWPVYSNM